jgi:hypothetical protein
MENVGRYSFARSQKFARILQLIIAPLLRCDNTLWPFSLICMLLSKWILFNVVTLLLRSVLAGDGIICSSIWFSIFHLTVCDSCFTSGQWMMLPKVVVSPNFQTSNAEYSYCCSPSSDVSAKKHVLLPGAWELLLLPWSHCCCLGAGVAAELLCCCCHEPIMLLSLLRSCCWFQWAACTAVGLLLLPSSSRRDA